MLPIINLFFTFVLIVVFTIWSMKKKEALIYIFMIYFILSTYEWVSNTTLRWNALIMNINIVDIFNLYLVLFSIYNFFYNHRKMNKDKLNKIKYLKINVISLIMLIIVFVIAIFRGISAYGFGSEVIEDIRRFVEAWLIPVACIMYYPINLHSKEAYKALKILSTIIIIFCCTLWLLDLIFGIKIMSAQSDAGSTMRVLRPEQSVLISMLAIYFLDFDINRKNKFKISIRTLILMLIVILLQHRTAWVTLLIGLLSFIFMRNIKNKFSLKINKNLFYQIFFIVIVTMALLMIFSGSSIMNMLNHGLEGFKGEEGTTLDYRKRLWDASLSSLDSQDWILRKTISAQNIW